MYLITNLSSLHGALIYVSIVNRDLSYFFTLLLLWFCYVGTKNFKIIMKYMSILVQV